MNKLAKVLFTLLAMLCICPAHAQTSPGKISQEDMENYKQRIRQLVDFFEYTLNIVGNDTTAASDKEAIINSSYLKIFRDNKVQIEDDLDRRKTVTNKSVQAYLHDVDYFFRDVRFKYDILDIANSLTDQNKVYFKVSLNRNLKGITLDGDTVSNNRKRFIELNLDLKRKDLKIASIYTSPTSEEEELDKWWTNLSDKWQELLLGAADIKDSISPDNLRKITQVKELNLSYSDISDLEPLEKLSSLTRLDLSHTPVKNITPLLNLNELEALSLSNTPVQDLLPLKYSLKLKELNISYTAVSSMDIPGNLLNLEKLELSNTAVKNIEPLSRLQKLRLLNCSATDISSIKPLSSLQSISSLDLNSTIVDSLQALKELTNLEYLNASATKVSDISPLSGLKKLRVLHINNTGVSSMRDLSDMPALENIYCDNTKIGKDEIIAYIHAHPRVLVVYESENSSNWWSKLSEEWKTYFTSAAGLKGQPSNEQLASITRLTDINISGNKSINSLDPLTQLPNLKTLNASGTMVSDLKPLENLKSLELLDLSGTGIADISPLFGLKNLKKLICNSTKIKEDQLSRMKSANPRCLIIFNSDYLNKWWSGLSPDWKVILSKRLNIKASPSEEQLHVLVNMDSLNIDNRKILSLVPLNDFNSLRILIINQTSISSLTDLKAFAALERLQCSNSPLSSLDGIEKQPKLRVLDVSNTAVKDPSKLEMFRELLVLNISGTKIRSLKKLSRLNSLKALNCSNTRICRLPLTEVKSLSYLSCFNTRIGKGKIDRFRKEHPGCEVRYY